LNIPVTACSSLEQGWCAGAQTVVRALVSTLVYFYRSRKTNAGLLALA